MAELLAQATLVALLSEYEAHPVAVMEALSLERPVLVTRTSGLQDLSIRASVLRYDPKHAADDGLGGSIEGAFSAYSFWLVECLAHIGKSVNPRILLDARIRLEKLLSMSNHVGLYAEEIDTMGHALGNFPQAFTHLTLISACLALNNALDESER